MRRTRTRLYTVISSLVMAGVGVPRICLSTKTSKGTRMRRASVVTRAAAGGPQRQQPPPYPRGMVQQAGQGRRGWKVCSLDGRELSFSSKPKEILQKLTHHFTCAEKK